LPTAIELLEELVAIPSVSGTEEAIARFLAETAARAGLDVVRDDASVTMTVDSGRPARTYGARLAASPARGFIAKCDLTGAALARLTA